MGGQACSGGPVLRYGGYGSERVPLNLAAAARPGLACSRDMAARSTIPRPVPGGISSPPGREGAHMNIGRVGTWPVETKPAGEAVGSRNPPSQGIPRAGDGGLGTVPVPVLLSHLAVPTGGSSGYHPALPRCDNPASAGADSSPPPPPRPPVCPHVPSPPAPQGGGMGCTQTPAPGSSQQTRASV